MQASKIIPGRTYAVKRGEHLLRFRVTEVLTTIRRRSTKVNQHDYTSQIEGVFVDPDIERDGRVATFAPEAVLGEYDEYTELKEREAKEKAAAVAQKTAEQRAATSLVNAFYHLTRQEEPKDQSDYGNMYRIDYSRNVMITPEGASKLLSVFDDVFAKMEVA